MATQEQVTTQAIEYQSGWLPQMWALMRWNLFVTWRRIMSKIMLAILLAGYVLIVGVEYLISRVGNPAVGAQFSALLTFPFSMAGAQSYLEFLGPILLCILAGAILGSEYTYGTQRQQLGRGLSRVQVLTAQIVAMAVIALFTAVLMFILSSLVGLTLGPSTGTPLKALTLTQWEGTLLYWLATAVRLFIYMLIAMFMATLGKSVIAGIAFSLGIIVVEGILSTVFSILAISFRSNQLSEFLANVPKWLPGSGGSTLTTAASQMIDPAGQTPLGPNDVWQGVTAVLIYAIVLIAASYLFYTSRDLAE
jgi:ABC-type transport system involved in multi-copper enzyme maturation permease subunit